jgi:hypothetical protein
LVTENGRGEEVEDAVELAAEEEMVVMRVRVKTIVKKVRKKKKRQRR